MALVRYKDYIDIGSGGPVDAVSYQVALDENFTQIIDQSLHDTVNLDHWYTMLPKIGVANEYYADESKLWARVKIHVDTFESPWFVIGPKDQNKQDVIITEEGKPDIHTTSDAIGME